MKNKSNFETDEKNTIRQLKQLNKNFQVKSSVKKMAADNIMQALEPKKRSSRMSVIPSVGFVCMAFIAIVSFSLLTFPDMAVRYAGGLPLVRELAQKEENVQNISRNVLTMEDKMEQMEKTVQRQNDELQALEEQVDQLQMHIKEISREEIREVITSENEDEMMNLQLQTLVVNFVKALYRDDLDTAAAYCTPEFAKEVKEHPEYIIMRRENAVVFTQITNIAQLEDGTYLVFLRLNDSDEEEQEADYQIDFEIIEEDGVYLIRFAGMNA